MKKFINDNGNIIFATEKAFEVLYQSQGYKEVVEEVIREVKKVIPKKANTSKQKKLKAGE